MVLRPLHPCDSLQGCFFIFIIKVGKREKTIYNIMIYPIILNGMNSIFSIFRKK
jgi:hypothetical protein